MYFEFEETLEFSTGVICNNTCMKYCPKEVFIKNYHGDKKQLLSFENFKTILSTVPKNVYILFSGFSEPFVNSETIDMIKYAQSTGYKLGIFTTLNGASESAIDELIKIPFYHFCLHLPDGKVLSIQHTKEYVSNIFKVIENIGNVEFMAMNDTFSTNKRENVIRGSYQKAHHFGYCRKRVIPQFAVLPNGDVQLCCNDFGLWHKVGNLINEDYPHIKRRFLKTKKFKLCYYCSEDLPYPVYAARRIALKVATNPKLLQAFKVTRS